MEFWVYENWQAGPHKALVHAANCPYCNNGGGTHPGTSDLHGRWHGPFATREAAFAQASRTEAVEVRACRKCGGLP
ncbi:MAG: hypothetical protein FJX75_12625 [Armatimonadetes bacterium]|nr:hypothetical protein [Armatimonadota bacterium]